MPPSAIDAQIRARIESFTHELAELVKQVAVESVQDAMSGGTTTRRTKKAKRSTKPAKRAAKPRSGRRSPAQVLAHVRKNPGQRLEEIGAALGVSTADLKAAVATLLDEKKVRTTGKARGTKYFAGLRGKKAAKKKATRKGRKKAGKRKAKKAGRKASKRVGRKKAKGAKRKTVRKAVSKVLKKAKRKATKKRPTRKKATAKRKVVPTGPEAIEAA
jgi:hypothetical protein